MILLMKLLLNLLLLELILAEEIFVQTSEVIAVLLGMKLVDVQTRLIQFFQIGMEQLVLVHVYQLSDIRLITNVVQKIHMKVRLNLLNAEVIFVLIFSGLIAVLKLMLF